MSPQVAPFAFEWLNLILGSAPNLDKLSLTYELIIPKGPTLPLSPQYVETNMVLCDFLDQAFVDHWPKLRKTHIYVDMYRVMARERTRWKCKDGVGLGQVISFRFPLLTGHHIKVIPKSWVTTR